MRFEAKHRISKISANSSSNRRNICMSLAIRQQLLLNNLFIKGNLGNTIESGCSKNLISDTDIQNIKRFMVIDSLDSLISCSWISIKGTKYQTGMILTLDVNQNSLPEFGIINDIYFYNNTAVVFKCLKLNTIGYDEHFCSYEVITPIINEVLIYHPYALFSSKIILVYCQMALHIMLH